MKEPKFNSSFDVDDIHKLREYNSKRREYMTQEERLAETKEAADKMEKEINEIRKKRKVSEK